MKRERTILLALVAVCGLSLAGEAFARGGGGGGQGGGIRMQKRDGSCVNNQATTKTRNMTQTKQQTQDGTALGTGSTRQGTGAGAMRRLGPGDGSGNTTRPLDGTGYGSPAN